MATHTPTGSHRRFQACQRCHRMRKRCSHERPCLRCIRSGNPCEQRTPADSLPLGVRFIYVKLFWLFWHLASTLNSRSLYSSDATYSLSKLRRLLNKRSRTWILTSQLLLHNHLPHLLNPHLGQGRVFNMTKTLLSAIAQTLISHILPRTIVARNTSICSAFGICISARVAR